MHACIPPWNLSRLSTRLPAGPSGGGQSNLVSLEGTGGSDRSRGGALGGTTGVQGGPGRRSSLEALSVAAQSRLAHALKAHEGCTCACRTSVVLQGHPFPSGGARRIRVHARSDFRSYACIPVCVCVHVHTGSSAQSSVDIPLASSSLLRRGPGGTWTQVATASKGPDTHWRHLQRSLVGSGHCCNAALRMHRMLAAAPGEGGTRPPPRHASP